MAWKVEYSASVESQLRRLEKQTARRIVDYMRERVAPMQDL